MERHIELGFSNFGAARAFDMHSVAHGDEARAIMSFESAGLDSSIGRELGTGWLEAAAEEYGVSSNIKEYAIVPVIMFPSGLPNRNSIAFSLRSLGRFDPEMACLGYQSWNRRPTFFNHVNDDHTKAKGVIFDTRMVPLANTNNRIWKAVALAGFDRSRDPVLANNILTNAYNSYSMGASVGQYECAVCGHKPTKNDNRCEHIGLDSRQMRLFDQPGRGKVLAHYVCDYIRGFELSCVHPTPAWASAHTPAEQLMSME